MATQDTAPQYKHIFHKNMSERKSPAMYLVVFGASGDLAKKKLFPELATIGDKKIHIIAYARSDIKDEFQDRLKKFCDYDQEFLSRITYVRGEYNDLSPLKEYLSGPHTEAVYYFSVPPSVYPILLESLESFPPSAIGIEKPFGVDLKSFETILSFKKHRLHFVDHYLVKPAILAWPHLIPEFLSATKYPGLRSFRKIDALFSESIKVENMQHFDKSGVIMDVVQNHLTEVFASAIALLSDADTKDIAQSRADVISRLKIRKGECRRAQYEGYAEGSGSGSQTETAALILFEYDSEEHIPVRFIAGKAAQTKETSVRMHIKKEYYETFAEIAKIKVDLQDIDSMCLVFYVEPNAGVHLAVVRNGYEDKWPLISPENISKCAKDLFGPLKGHGIIFNCLYSKKDFPSAEHEEAREAWKLFTELLSEKRGDLKKYAKGMSMESLQDIFKS